MHAIFPDRMEEELKAAFFRATPGGFFVDVGANAPRDGSQSWSLEQRGWNGVLIEPQADLADALRRERRAKVYAVACSSPGNAGKTLTLYLAGIQSSLKPDFYVAGMRREGTVEVPVMTLDQVLEDADAPRALDFVSIDVEGHAIEVLEGFTLARWQPRLLFIEDVVQDLSLHRYLTRRGYRWFRRTGINSWYVPAGAAERVSLAGRLQFLRKYYLGLPFRILREAKRRWRKQ
ncbi:MAG TPA: FkbM family methyltransferase [Xanthobacteraceae bacterium]|nr:FkbM family methyltransferase [Xanthobacteraceae bacterium]